jgi:hypothetical protein
LGEDFVITGWAAFFAAKNVPPAEVERVSLLLRQALAHSTTKEKHVTSLNNLITPLPRTTGVANEIFGYFLLCV